MYVYRATVRLDKTFLASSYVLVCFMLVRPGVAWRHLVRITTANVLVPLLANDDDGRRTDGEKRATLLGQLLRNQHTIGWLMDCDRKENRFRIKPSNVHNPSFPLCPPID
ncbi:hypothetical protein ZHAS_00005802 [Anopheles sinensis]|uniref:Uncharacterized protein n=1 Tax=Anopheles sinensis TaxID=74873 RepID=A0A084VK98_ANOSI|nr:hypothetical protein ZHAS_00005802 [Anopheles sinensis]